MKLEDIKIDILTIGAVYFCYKQNLNNSTKELRSYLFDDINEKSIFYSLLYKLPSGIIYRLLTTDPEKRKYSDIEIDHVFQVTRELDLKYVNILELVVSDDTILDLMNISKRVYVIENDNIRGVSIEMLIREHKLKALT